MGIVYPNFYENVEEAVRRLKGTVVMYDKDPYSILYITNHKVDGTFRVYMVPFGNGKNNSIRWPEDFFHAEARGSATLGAWLDTFLETDAGSKSGIIRKKINSPAFNKFRPFPFGMCNYGGDAFYVARRPLRQGTQGCSVNGLSSLKLSLNAQDREYYDQDGPLVVPFNSPEILATIRGNYPTPFECLENMKAKGNTNTGAAFHRDFAFVRGPIGLFFLAYRMDIIGLVDPVSRSVALGREHRQYTEVTKELNFFSSVSINQ